MRDKTITFTQEEINLIYSQLQARKQYFEDDLKYWGYTDITEAERCMDAIQQINDIMERLLY